MTSNTIFDQEWSTLADTRDEVSSDSDSDENSEDAKTVERRLVDHTDIFPSYCSTTLHYLDVDETKILKCSAHLILGVDFACELIFMNTRQKIGVQKLIPISVAEKLFKSCSSIHTLGLIAIAKLLSPRHAAHSISLYHEYTQWMGEEEIEHA